MNKRIILVSLLAITFIVNSCEKDKPFVPFFSVEDDIKLGKQVRDEIASMPAQFPVLSEQTYPSAYAYINKIRDKILNSEKVAYKNDFDWEIRIIKDDTTLNAFCTPGGYIYVYTGLIKYLNSEEQLAGVMGHEIAHADRRHTSRSLQAQYGVSLLLSVVLGNDSSTLSQIAGGLYNLKNSREHEEEADEYSVTYLCPTDYQADGAADFFVKLITDGNDCESAFFSTHPCPSNRVQKIQERKIELGCSGNQTFTADYTAFKNMLP